MFGLIDKVEIAGFAYSPFYYGGLSALMIRDLIDDQVLLEVMTAKTVRRSRVRVLGSTEVILHHLPARYYLGFENVLYGDIIVPVSTPEKTLIDLRYFKIPLSKVDYSKLVESADLARLRRILRVYDLMFAREVIDFYRGIKLEIAEGKLSVQY